MAYTLRFRPQARRDFLALSRQTQNRRCAVERQFQVEDEVVWGVVKVNLPTLQDTLNHLLGP